MATRMVTFRLTATEARELYLAARRRGMTVSDLCRECLYRVCGVGELREAQAPPQADPPRSVETPRAETPRVLGRPADVRRSGACSHAGGNSR